MVKINSKAHALCCTAATGSHTKQIWERNVKRENSRGRLKKNKKYNTYLTLCSRASSMPPGPHPKQHFYWTQSHRDAKLYSKSHRLSWHQCTQKSCRERSNPHQAVQHKKIHTGQLRNNLPHKRCPTTVRLNRGQDLQFLPLAATQDLGN